MRAPEFHRLLLRKFKDSAVLVEGGGAKAAGIVENIDDNFNVILSVGDRLVIFRGSFVDVIKRMAE